MRTFIILFIELLNLASFKYFYHLCIDYKCANLEIIIGLSATIGNPKQLADWLEATLVIDDWRPVELKQGIFSEGKIEFY